MQDNNELIPIITNINQPKKLLDDKFQKKIIKILIEDEQFSKEVLDMLKEEYFEGILPVTIITYILKYFENYGNVPNYDTLSDLINIKETDENTKNHLLEFIRLTKECKLTDKKHVVSYTKSFCKKQSLRRGLEEAAKAWENEEYEAIHKIIIDSMRVGDSRDRGHNYIDDVEKRLLKSLRNPVPFLEGFDHKIGGGLASGELGVILAATGGGKSMMLVKGAATALSQGKSVLYYSMELAETSIANRFDSCLTGLKLSSILNYPNAIRDKAQDIASIGGKLIIKEYPTGTASVNTLRSHVKHLEREGFVPDVIFVDYADIMKATSTFNEKRFALTSIYESLRALAMELSLPIWTASQAGRAAVNESKFDLKVISESLGKAQTADVIIGIGRSDDDKLKRKAQLLLLKNRNGEDGFSLELNFDTSNIDISIVLTDNNNMGYSGLGETMSPIEDALRMKKLLNNPTPEDFDYDYNVAPDDF